MDRIIELINQEKWEKATDEIIQYLEKNPMTPEIAVLAATVCEVIGDRETAYEYIISGLSVNPVHYELLYLLGNYYASVNSDQAFLCYEKALYYAIKQKSEDVIFLQEMVEQFRQKPEVSVRKVSFVILSYNTLEYTKQCLDSIVSNCDSNAYEIVVVDNGSTDGSREWLETVENIIYVPSKENLGFAGGCNLGIQAANTQNDIFLLNNDTIVPLNAVFYLRMGLYASSENGMAGSVTNQAVNSQVVPETFGTLGEYMDFAFFNNTERKRVHEYKTWLVGFAVLIKRSVLNKVGMLDERFYPGNFEDNDYGLRVREAGYRNVLCWNSFIFHWGSKSFKENSVVYADAISENLQKLKDKWGYVISYYSMVRKELLPFIEQKPEDTFSVLEIGCGSGETLSRIKMLYPNAKLYGIEISKEIVKVSLDHITILEGNIEELAGELPFGGIFDYIIMADVLEHLVWPNCVLDKLRKNLNPRGKLITSIPNLQNASVIYDLLHGKFTYRDSGILDRTHLRFFTYKEIIKLFDEADYSIEKIHSVKMSGETTESHKEFFDGLLAMDSSIQKEYLDTYQYLVVAQNNAKAAAKSFRNED